jgi:predicted HTH transcriptional regulator
LIADYIREHGPTPSGKLSRVIGIKDAAYYLKKSFVMVEPAQLATYAATEAGRQAKIAYQGKGAAILESLVESGAQTADGLASRLDMERSVVTGGIRQMMRHGFIEKVRENRPALWGLKEGPRRECGRVYL